MNRNSFYISFGIWLVIISLLGVPIVWRNALVMFSGLFLILFSASPVILKKLHIKHKPKRKQEKLEFENQNLPGLNQETDFSEPKNENQMASDKHEN